MDKDSAKNSLTPVHTQEYTSGSKISSTYDNTDYMATMKDSVSSKIQNTKAGGTNKRGFMVLIYCLMNFSCGFLSSPLAPISKASKNVFDKGLGTINLASSVFSFAGLFTGLLANMLIQKVGIRKSTILTALLFTLGMGVKMLGNWNFYMIIAGEVIAGLGGPFVQNGIGNFADHWFEGPKRGICTSILSTMNPIGTMVGFVYPFIFVSTKGTVTQQRNQINQYFLSHVVFTGALLIICILFFQERSKHHKSNANDRE